MKKILSKSSTAKDIALDSIRILNLCIKGEILQHDENAVCNQVKSIHLNLKLANAFNDAGGIELAATILKTDNASPYIKEALMYLLANMSAESDIFRRDIAGAGGIMLAIKAIKQPDSSPYLKKCATALLGNLSGGSMERKRAIDKAGGIKLATEILANTDSLPDTKGFSLSLLSNLSTGSKDLAKSVIMAGGIELAIKAINQPEASLMEKKLALSLLEKLADSSRDNAVAITNALDEVTGGQAGYGIGVIVNLLSDDTLDTSVQINAVELLFQMCKTCDQQSLKQTLAPMHLLNTAVKTRSSKLIDLIIKLFMTSKLSEKPGPSLLKSRFSKIYSRICELKLDPLKNKFAIDALYNLGEVLGFNNFGRNLFKEFLKVQPQIQPEEPNVEERSATLDFSEFLIPSEAYGMTDSLLVEKESG